MKKIFLCILSVVCLCSESKSAPKLSEKASVSLITCGPGEALYEAFGHSAIRISDPAQGLDAVFNYGVFDFNQENFYLNFARGNMLYRLGMSQTADFIYSYRYYGRSVRAQILNLDSTERQAVFDYLDKNLLPENRNYLYNYFRNNCSTKIPEMLDSALKGKVIWQHSEIPGKASYRSLIYDYSVFQPWGRLGIDLGLGAGIDSRIEGKDLNFLPIELEKSFNRARIKRNMTEFPLVLRNETLFEAPVFFGTPPFLTSPDCIFTLILLVCGILWFFSDRWELPFCITRVVLFSLAGVLGLVETCIWFFTNHVDAAWNFNLLWACPALLPLGFLSLIRESKTHRFTNWLKYYYFFLPGIWFFLPQTLNSSLIPLVMALGICSLDPRIKILSDPFLPNNGHVTPR
jgi:hypothetical protein